MKKQKVNKGENGEKSIFLPIECVTGQFVQVKFSSMCQVLTNRRHMQKNDAKNECLKWTCYNERVIINML